MGTELASSHGFTSVRRPLPDLDWSIPSPRSRLDYGFHSSEERRARRATVAPVVNATRLVTSENIATPIAFRDVLIGIARGVEMRHGGSTGWGPSVSPSKPGSEPKGEKT